MDQENKPFELDDIEDVKIIIEAKGKNYSILPTEKEITKESSRELRVELAKVLLNDHYVVVPSLEEIRDNKEKFLNNNDSEAV